MTCARRQAGLSKTLGQMERPDIPSDLPSIQEVKKKLEDLRQQKERLVAQKAEEDVSWENVQSRLKQVQAEIEEVSSEILSPSEEQELLQLESQRDRTEKLRQDLADMIAEQKAVETSLVAVGGLKGKCPTCSQSISEEVRTTEMEALRERLADLEGLIQGAREELSEYAGIEAATSRLEGHHRALAGRGKLEEEQSKLRAELRPNGSDLESRMTMLVERINKGERVLEKVQHF